MCYVKSGIYTQLKAYEQYFTCTHLSLLKGTDHRIVLMLLYMICSLKKSSYWNSLKCS